MFIIVKNEELWKWWFYFCLRFRCHFFRHTDCAIDEFFLKKFFNFDLKGVIEKCVGCFLSYLFLRGFFIKSVGMCDILRKLIVTFFLVCFYD